MNAAATIAAILGCGVTAAGGSDNPAQAVAAHDDYAASVRARIPQHLAFSGQINLMPQERDATQLVLLDGWDDRAALDQFHADAATAQRLAAVFEARR